MLRLAFFTSLAVAVLCSCARKYDEKEAERYIVESEQQCAESVATGDPTVFERINADDFVGVDPKGRFYDKAEMIADTPEGPKHLVSNHANDIKVRFYGDTAVAQGSETWQQRSGERGRLVWTDTWVRRDGKWQVVAAEDVIAPEYPAKP